MSKTKTGDTIKVAYIGTLQDGTEFDRSKDNELLQFTIGNKEVVPGFEKAVIDMEIGETKTVTILPEEAYGQYNKDDVVEVTRSVIPDNIVPKVGMRLKAQNRNGDPIIVTITALEKNTVVLDANHPLAGKDLTFKI